MEPETQEKTVAEVRVYEFNFEAQPEIRNGSVITSVESITVTPSGELILGTPAIDVAGKKVQVQLSAGVFATSRYLLICIVGLDSGPKRLEMSGVLSMIEFALPSL